MKKFSLSKLAVVLSVLAAVLGVCISFVKSTVWWAGYDKQNCPGCRPIIDWSEETTNRTTAAVTSNHIRAFKKDGVVVLKSLISPSKVVDLATEVESMTDTFMTSVLTKTVLPSYRKYEHKLETRSEIIRDWAVHGPLAKWAADLMDVSEARLYNAEKIYSAGNDNPMGCNTAWHRDTLSSPFPTTAKSITINIYLDDIGADGPNGDALIYIKGSHNHLVSPPSDVTSSSDLLFEPILKVGDVLAHDAHVYHTPSGRGCWHRRSLQFRYVESPTRFTFAPNRFPNGPIPWTFAHAPNVAPHRLKEGSALEGPWYPMVYPKPLESEHVPIGGRAWSIIGVLGVAKQSLNIAADLGIGSNNCVVDHVVKEVEGYYPYFGFDGPVTSCENWEMVNQIPVHKDGQMVKNLQKMENNKNKSKK
eukprot:CAMPEP_0195526740 /NCGR_PEP_ID=MMETSP0794_2-20130614/27989_1 /TAXON_ID=515487 /ORGANISM="Stephanopyxis turris, Strain CCMP 815" /LENGTH=417 /DNA_ID=CAMNT_0040657501 /DNA_START=105 /DNA_END=1358 /DNA_ORIENTATION=+